MAGERRPRVPEVPWERPLRWVKRRVSPRARWWLTPAAIVMVWVSMIGVTAVCGWRIATGHQLIAWTNREVRIAGLGALVAYWTAAVAAWDRRYEPIARWLSLTLASLSGYVIAVIGSLAASRHAYWWVIHATWWFVPLTVACWAMTADAVIDSIEPDGHMIPVPARRAIVAWRWALHGRLGTIGARQIPALRRVSARLVLIWGLCTLFAVLGEMPGILVSRHESQDGPWRGLGYHAHNLYFLVAAWAIAVFAGSAVALHTAWRLRGRHLAAHQLRGRWAARLAAVYTIFAMLLFLASGEGYWPEAVIDLLLVPAILAFAGLLLAERSPRTTKLALRVLSWRLLEMLLAITVVTVAILASSISTMEAIPLILISIAYLGQRILNRSRELLLTGVIPPTAGAAAAPAARLPVAKQSSSSPRPAPWRPRRHEFPDVDLLGLLAAPLPSPIGSAASEALRATHDYLERSGFEGRHMHALFKNPIDRPGHRAVDRRIDGEPLARLLDFWAPLLIADTPNERRRLLLKLVYETAPSLPTPPRHRGSPAHPPVDALLQCVCLRLNEGPFAPPDRSDEHEHQQRLDWIYDTWALGDDLNLGGQRYVDLNETTASMLRRLLDREVVRGTRRRDRGIRPTDRANKCQRHYDQWLPVGFELAVAHWIERCERGIPDQDAANAGTGNYTSAS